VPALGPGTSNAGQLSVTIPAGHPTGLYYILAKSDAGNVVSESSETNNSAQKSISITP
jgi:subtilase family serine protease